MKYRFGTISWFVVMTSVLYAAEIPFTKSKRCAECHAEIYRTYARTPMALSAGNTAAGSLPAKFNNSSFTDQHSKFGYTAGRDALGYFFNFRNVKAAGDIPMSRRLPYFIGSGTAAQAFAIAVDGFLYEAPVTSPPRVMEVSRMS